MIGVTQILLLFLIGCAIAVSVTRDLLTSVIIYMSFSMVMCIIWITLESPDLAITEAAVGTGITSLLYFLTLKKIHAIDAGREAKAQEAAMAAAQPAADEMPAVETAVVSEAAEDLAASESADAVSDVPAADEAGTGGAEA